MRLAFRINSIYRSEGFVLTRYDIPGCVEDGAWMLWENSSAAVAAAVFAHRGGGKGEPGVWGTHPYKIVTFCENSFFHDWVPYRRDAKVMGP